MGDNLTTFIINSPRNLYRHFLLKYIILSSLRPNGLHSGENNTRQKNSQIKYYN